MKCSLSSACSIFNVHLHLHLNSSLWSYSVVLLGWQSKVSLFILQLFFQIISRRSKIRFAGKEDIPGLNAQSIWLTSTLATNSRITLLPSDALSLVSAEVPKMIYQDILEDYKEKGRKSLKNCKKIESNKLFIPEYTRTIQKWGVAGFFYIYISDLLYDLGQVVHPFCAFASVSALWK